MTALNQVVNDTGTVVYCGPTVIASIVNKPVSVVYKAIWSVKRTRKRPPIKGMYNRELKDAFARFGYLLVPVDFIVPLPERETLNQWARGRGEEEWKTTFVMVVGKHFVAVHGWKFVDSKVYGKPVFIEDAPCRRRRIRRLWKVVKM